MGRVYWFFFFLLLLLGLTVGIMNVFLVLKEQGSFFCISMKASV